MVFLPVQLKRYVSATKHGAHGLKTKLIKISKRCQSSTGTVLSTSVNSFSGLQKENILSKAQRIHNSPDLLETLQAQLSSN